MPPPAPAALPDYAAAFYRDEIAPYLPPAVLDFHTHTWLASNWRVKPWETASQGGKYMVTSEDYPPTRLVEDGRRAFPDRPYHAVVFGYPTPAADVTVENAFVASAALAHRGLYPLLIAGKPLAVPGDALAAAVLAQPFLGFKVYLPWYGDNYGATTLADMLSANEMAVANAHRLVVMLHVPSAGRLGDPAVQRGVEWLAKDFPDAQLVLAHGGRCYLPAEMRRALPCLRALPNVCLDCSMVMDPLVLLMLFDAIGPQRVLFATDFPVAAMRGRRVRVLDHWVDVTTAGYPESAFRVQSDGIRASYMAIEIALAVRDAALQAGLSAAQLRDVFYANGMAVLERALAGAPLRRLRAAWGERA